MTDIPVVLVCAGTPGVCTHAKSTSRSKVKEKYCSQPLYQSDQRYGACLFISDLSIRLIFRASVFGSSQCVSNNSNSGNLHV